MTRERWISTGLVIGVVLSLVPLLTIGGGWGSLLSRTVKDAGHVPLFGWITTLLLLIASRWGGSRIGPPAQYLAAFVLALGLGLGTELIQMIGPRDADAWDLIRNGLGAFCALAWWPTFDRRFDGTRVRGKRARLVLRGAVVLLVLVSAFPILVVARAYHDRSRRLPLLYDFQTASQERFMDARRAWWELTAPPAAWREDAPESVAHVSFSHFAESSLVLKEPHPDWTGHDVLEFEVFHPGEGSLEFAIRIDDRHRWRRWSDRFGRHVFLEPGLNRIRIPIDDVLHGPTDRLLDLTKIKRIVMYPVEPAGGYQLYLGSIGLVTAASTSPD